MDFYGCEVATNITKDMFKGQKVFGRLARHTKFGTTRQYIVAQVEGCVALPDGVDEGQAAAIGTAALTVYQGIKPFFKKGPKLMIYGGSGGTEMFGYKLR